jgi:TolB protein
VLLTSQREDPGGDIVRAEFVDGALRNRRNLTATSSTPDRTPAWSHDGQRIAFTAYRSGQPRLWVMGGDGSDAHEVAPSSGDWGDFSPDWSPDGQWLVFQRVGRGETGLGLVSLDGGAVTLLERPGRRTYDARFSADGTVLAAWERTDAGDDVVLLSLDGGVLRVIDTGGSDRHPSWR